MTFCASAWLLQKSGSLMRFSVSASCSSRRAPSKMPPEFGGSLVEPFIPAYQIFEFYGHCLPPTDRNQGANRQDDRGIGDHVPDSRIDRPFAQDPDILDQ